MRRTSYDTVTQDDPAYTWSPAYSKVSGDLPLADLPRVGLNLNLRGKSGAAFVRTELDVTQAGKIGLKLNDPAGLSLWLGSKPVEIQQDMELTLEPGQQRLTFAVDLDQRKTDLRLELKDIAGSPAQVQFVTGK